MISPEHDGYRLILSIPTPPMGKPRMTQRDKWAKRNVVKRWNAYKDVCRIYAGEGFMMPLSEYWMVFRIEMPQSWSDSKRNEMLGKPHQSRPDKDNLEKGILDIFLPEDSLVWDGRAMKLWDGVPSIEIWVPR